jgi:hypothetical protein
MKMKKKKVMVTKDPPVKKRKNTVTRVGATTPSGKTVLAHKKDSSQRTTYEVSKINPNKKSPLNSDDRKSIPKRKLKKAESDGKAKATYYANRKKGRSGL